MSRTTFSFTIERKGILDSLMEGLVLATTGFVGAMAEAMVEQSERPERPADGSTSATPKQERARRFQERRLDAFLDRAFEEFMRFIWTMNQRTAAATATQKPAPADPCPVPSPLGAHSKECGHVQSPEPPTPPAAPAESAPNPP